MKVTDLVASGIVIWRMGNVWALKIPGLSVRTSRRQADLIAYLAYQAGMAA